MKWSDEQCLAINSIGNVIVSAGAGSGKTAVLSERVKELLLKGYKIDHFLVLTFTKNAADNMKKKIREKMEKEPTLVSEIPALESADISTYDSFELKLVKKYGYLNNIDSNIQIIDESILKTFIIEYLNELMKQYYDEDNELLLDIINNYLNKDDEDLVNLIYSTYAKVQVLNDTTAYLDDYFSNYHTKEKFDFYVEGIKQYIKHNISLLIGSIDRCYPVDGQIAVSKLLRELEDEVLDGHYDAISKFKFPMLPRGSSEEDKKLKQTFTKRYANLVKLPYSYITVEDESFETYEEQKPLVQFVIDTVKKINEKVEAFKKSINQYTFNDIAKMAISLIKNNDVLRGELKSYYQIIMIDEYQDTSDIQEELISLIENTNCFMVGDIKQSIYRFRNANPNIFKSKYDLYANNQNGKKIDLTANFRSRPEVINDINYIFSNIMSDEVGDADYKKSHLIKSGNKDYEPSSDYDSELLIFNRDNNKVLDEIHVIIQDIIHKINSGFTLKNGKKCKFSDFTILVDKGTTFDIYAREFAKYSIPLYNDTDRNISSEYLVSLVKNMFIVYKELRECKFTSAYLHSLVSLFKSYLFNYSDEQIYNIVKNNEIYDNELVRKMMSVISKTNNQSNEKIYFAMKEEFGLLNYINKLGKISENILIIHYIDSLITNMSNLKLSLDKVIEYFTLSTNSDLSIKLQSIATSDNSVTITNIHKSKGLEYGIVYFSQLLNNFASDSKGTFIFSVNSGVAFDSDKNLINTYYSKIMGDKEMLSERLRLLYVSLTRTKEKMIFLIPEDAFKKDRELEDSKCFYDFLNSSGFIKQKDKIKVTLTDDRLNNKQEEINNVIKFQHNSLDIKTKEVAPMASSELTHKDEKTVLFGTFVHEILESIDYNNPDLTHIKDIFIKNKVEKMIQSNLFKEIRSYNIYHEYEFIKDRRKYSIDLLAISQTKAIIVDYKLKSIEDNNYLKQLAIYKEYITSQYNVKVETYLYSILDELSKKVE